MKAVVRDRYGSPDVLQLKDIEKPVPKDGEVLVRIHATSVNAFDWRMLRGEPFLARMAEGLRSPKHPILGADIAGRVDAVGANAGPFQPGDDVFGDVGESGCGGFAEYVAARAQSLARKPAGLSFEDAAAVPMAGVTALRALRDSGKLQPGQTVMIHGAAGGVGTFAVQIAKLLGGEVTAICSTAKVELMRSLGADHVIDYTQEDFAHMPARYDLIIGVNGNRSLRDFRRALTPRGKYIMAGGGNTQLFQPLILGPLMSMFSSKKVGVCAAKPTRADLEYMAGLLVNRQIIAVIDRCYPLEKTPDAIRYVDAGHARGKVLITQAVA